ncbi:uncharacterized protein LOC128960121 [Oppia nitens]|uniref:uncharacterized protein LOC128960121 n=1 Tax=Oppia nitens TaxID=1686743 RepID=UPI0023D9AC4F|nr:uncharacterized protein LOC128960121 [Oppia nitens]
MPLKSPKVFITGDVIQEFKPIAHIVNNEFKGDFCDNCLKPSTNLKKCKACLQMNYCDKQCQKQDWKSYHKYECGYMSDNNYVFLMSLSTSKLLALRFYLRYQRCPEFSSQVIQLYFVNNFHEI